MRVKRLLALLFVCALSAGLRSIDSAGASSQGRKIDFNRDIRPILADKCLACHGPDAPNRRIRLRLDSEAGARADLGGGRRAIVPGRPEESALIHRVGEKDDAMRMPPVSTGKSLTPAEIELLAEWIRQGAAFQTHWAFLPPVRPALPAVRDKAWPRNPIDHFVLARLEAEGLRPAPEADRAALLRRVTLDLTGLPPTPEELDAFLRDRAPDAYEKVVDRLLASPRYGERMAFRWLDAARYADTNGYQIDGERSMWRWRDWVIEAFNRNLSFDQFVIEQLAGDLLPQPTMEQRIATGFNRNHRMNAEDGIVPEEYFVEYIVDRVDTTSTVFLGLTMGCARCHNHKFDPIPTHDYYSLFTIFANTREPEELPLLDARAAADNRHTRALDEERRRIEEEIAKLREKRFPELKALYRTAPEIARLLVAVWESRNLKTEAELQKFAREKDVNAFLLPRWRATVNEGPIWAVWRGLAAIPEEKFAAAAAAEAIAAAAGASNPRVLEAFRTPPATLREAAEIYGKLLASFDRPAPCADPHEEALRLALHGEGAPTNVGFGEYEKIMLSTDRQNENGKRRRLETMLLALAYEGAPPRAQSVEDVPEPQPGHVLRRGNPANRGEEVKPQFLRILAGDARRPFADGSGRLDLARAIADSKNPLTARVIVNRVWQHHFGAGIVRTPSDFGTRGERPTHPELLDHLARGFIDGGWSLKALHRRIMLSRAYRQSSSPEAGGGRNAAEIDPENRLLWKMNRRRLDFEELRDSLLAAGGGLDRRLGGLPESAIAWPYGRRRTLYSFIDRALVPNDFRIFDFASPDAHSPQRHLTTVPQQALLMMNSPFVISQAQALLARPEIAGERDARRRVQRLYRLLFGRAPAAEELAAGLAFVRDEANDAGLLSPAEEARARAWSYGTGDAAGAFTPYSHFLGGAWRSSAMPGDPRTPTHFLAAHGGFASEEKGKALIRRWTAPFDGRVSIRGVFEQRFDNGCRKCDGLPARIRASRAGSLGAWTGKQGAIETNLDDIRVARGETIDLLVEAARTQEFKGTVAIRRLDGPAEEWDSARDFRHPAAGRMTAWERYAQVLLASAEFMMID